MSKNTNTHSRWEIGRIHNWYARKGWLVGCNFIPSTAVNQLEMWQADTFDPARISLELGWAAKLGMNTVRVFLHDVAWEVDPQGFLQRIARFLDIAADLGFSTLLVLLDDCWNPGAQAGPQPAPIPGVHNSRWLQCPGITQVADPAAWPRLKRYVQAILEAFATDERVLAWDLYNEPGNSGMGDRSLPLLQSIFAWAREIDPGQPLTAGLWADLPVLNSYQLSASDVISFHHYKPADHLQRTIQELKGENRPILCTEYMARTLGSLFETHLPVFWEEQIGCYNWGLVAGKTQTYFPWGSPQDAAEPEIWFTDILRPDGTPFRADEVDLISEITARRLALRSKDR
jgi:hypothetical protein